MKILDCRGMSCPLPVVTVKRALEAGQGESLTVLLDNGAPRENVTRFVLGRGYVVTEEQREGSVAVIIGEKEAVTGSAPVRRNGDAVVLITSERMGEGPEELGRLLLKNFLITLLDLTEVPDRILFVNSGVLLATEGSELLETLELLGNRGVEVLSCGLCLDFFQRKDQLAVGRVTNMFTIAESLLNSGTVIRP